MSWYYVIPSFCPLPPRSSPPPPPTSLVASAHFPGIRTGKPWSQPFKMSEFKGKVLLIVNVASTPLHTNRPPKSTPLPPPKPAQGCLPRAVCSGFVKLAISTSLSLSHRSCQVTVCQEEGCVGNLKWRPAKHSPRVLLCSQAFYLNFFSIKIPI